jgi:hypothetical protein
MDIMTDHLITFVFNNIPALSGLTYLFFNEIPAWFVPLLRTFVDYKGHSGFVRHFLKSLGPPTEGQGGQFDLPMARPKVPAKPCA